jgi:cytoplasmic iron level regulating protein YaaA (DUF328/UPF0246 family)
MLILLSPAKTLDFETPLTSPASESPLFAREANRLAAQLAELTAGELAALMQVSPPLAARTAQFYAAWDVRKAAPRARPAWAAYRGDVYAGLAADAWSDDDRAYAQRRLAILSGLYGLVRPLDRIQPYRLEMGTKLHVADGVELAEFWRPRITRALKDLLASQPAPTVVNLASDEYARAVDWQALGARVITPSFKEEKGGKLRFLSVFGKRARGLLARYLIEGRHEDPATIRRFRRDGYRLHTALSTPDAPLFTRPQPGGPSR